jgi:hypothetical protein
MLAEVNWTDRDLSKRVRISPKQIRHSAHSGVPRGQSTSSGASSVASGFELISSATITPSSGSFQNFVADRPVVTGQYIIPTNNFICSWSEESVFAATDRLVSTDLAKTSSEGFVTLYVVRARRAEPEAQTPADRIRALSAELHQALQQEPVLDGFNHSGEAILQRMFDEHPLEASAWVANSIANKNASSCAAEVLKLLCRFNPQSADWRLSIVKSALQSSSDEVRDVAIQAIEAWGEPALLDLLRSHSEKVSWLADYARQVLFDFGG